MGKSRFKMGIVVAGLIATSLIAGGAGTASAGDDQGGGGKGFDDVTCVILADGHNSAKKLAFKDENVDEVFKLADEMRAMGENNLCSFYDIDKYTIGVKTEGDVKPPESMSRIKGYSTGLGFSEEVCNHLGDVLDALETHAGNLLLQLEFVEAIDALLAAEQIHDIGLIGVCHFSSS